MSDIKEYDKMDIPIKITTESKKILEFILMELNKGVKAFSIYPENHPSLKALLDKSLQKVNELLERFDESQDVVISVERDTFYGEGGKELSREGMEHLANEFFHRRIKKLTISKEAGTKDWLGLIKLIITEPKDIMDMGGAEKFFIQEGIKEIRVNEIKYEDIVDMVKEDAKEEEEEVGQEEEETPEEEKEADEEPVQKEDELDRLLEVLEEEKDNANYRELVKTIVRKAVALKEAKEMDDLIKILYIFSKHSAPDSLRPKEQQDISLMAVKNLFDSYIAGVLIELLCIEEENRIKEISSIVLRIGEDMVPYLLDSLIERKDIRARRNLYNLIVEFGEGATGNIEARLEDDRWFAVRQMVSLLGTIGSPNSFKVLKKTLSYPDLKVKREVVKALAMLRTGESVQELINILSSAGPPLSLQAIISLGAIREVKAVPILIDLIEKRDLWGENHDVKKKAINALGNIG
ncbi:MAG: HEAT repeat domain-containing protein, partial [Thermodesulfobacteriota bacterium]